MRILLLLSLVMTFSAIADIRLWRTTANTNGNLGGRSGADAFCDGDANKPSVSGSTTRAYISVSDSDEIRDMTSLYNIPTNEVIYRLDGTTQIAANFAALLNSDSVALTNSINGVASSAGGAHTGSTSVGALDAAHCQNWTNSSSGNGMGGFGDSTSGTHLNAGLTACSLVSVGLFCLTYTTPSPSATSTGITNW